MSRLRRGQPAPRVTQISAAGWLGEVELLERVRAAVGRSFAVQLRDPELSGRDLLALAERLRVATRAAEVALIVNDRLDVAAAVEADGVHLGRRSVAVADARRLLGERLWVSRSCHGLDELSALAAEGADALLLSPIFATPGKGPALGLEALAEARRLLAELESPPALIALGGVNAERAGDCFAAGADGVASIRADLHRLA